MENFHRQPNASESTTIIFSVTFPICLHRDKRAKSSIHTTVIHTAQKYRQQTRFSHMHSPLHPECNSPQTNVCVCVRETTSNRSLSVLVTARTKKMKIKTTVAARPTVHFVRDRRAVQTGNLFFFVCERMRVKFVTSE